MASPRARLAGRAVASVVAALMIGAAPPARAAESSAEDAFARGVEAYRAQHYESALHAFLVARSRGMSAPNLDLDLGLSYYQLGRYDEARDAFERARADLRYTALADYHLGLVDAQEGRHDDAVAHFLSAQSMAQVPALRDMATVALRRLDDTPLEHAGTLPELARPDGSYYLRLGSGFDSNPSLINDTLDTPSGGGAGYVDLLGNLEHPLGTSALGTTLFRARVEARQHDRDTGYDEQSGELGLRQSFPLGAWRLGATGSAGAAFIDGAAYQSTAGGTFDARRALGQTVATLSYDLLRVSGEGVYDYLDGWRHVGSAELARSFGATRLRLSGDYEMNQRADLVVGQQFTSYSPTRTGALLTVGTPPLRRLSFELRGGYRVSRYPDEDRFLVNGTLEQRRRADTLATAGLRTRLRGGESWNWLLDYEYGRNDSNIDTFAYTRHVVLLGVEWLR